MNPYKIPGATYPEEIFSPKEARVLMSKSLAAKKTEKEKQKDHAVCLTRAF